MSVNRPSQASLNPRQPLKRSSSSPVLRLSSCATPTSKQSSSLVCCSPTLNTENPDICPRSWFQCCEEHPNYRRLPWSICFLVTCLPCCYPCYLTRTIRRGLGWEPKLDVTVDEEEGDRDLFNHTSDSVNKAMLRQTSAWRQAPATTLTTTTTTTRPPLKLLRVTVLLLSSELSPTLERVLSLTRRGQDQKDGGAPLQLVTTMDKTNKRSRTTASNLDTEDQIDASNKSDIGPSIKTDSKETSIEDESPISVPSIEVMRTSSSQETFVSVDKSEVQLRRDNAQRLGVPSLSSVRRTLSVLGRPVSRIARRVTHLNFVSSPVKRRSPRPLGTWSELVEELGYDVNFVVFNEEALEDVSVEGPAIDLVLLALNKGSVTDVDQLRGTTSTAMGNLRRYWSGFHPVLVVEVENNKEDGQQRRQSLPHYEACLSSLLSSFGSSHRITLTRGQLLYSAPWITECLARLFIHTRLYLCPTFVDTNEDNNVDECPGGCGLSKSYKSVRREGNDEQDFKDNRRERRSRPFTLFSRTNNTKESIYVRAKRVSKF